MSSFELLTGSTKDLQTTRDSLGSMFQVCHRALSTFVTTSDCRPPLATQLLSRLELWGDGLFDRSMSLDMLFSAASAHHEPLRHFLHNTFVELAFVMGEYNMADCIGNE